MNSANGNMPPDEVGADSSVAPIFQAGHSVGSAKGPYVIVEDSFKGATRKTRIVEMGIVQQASHESYEKAGYWFKSFPSSAVVQALNDQIAQYVVCDMHISGGAPGQSTELEVNSVIKKPCWKTLFSVGSECIVVPYFS